MRGWYVLNPDKSVSERPMMLASIWKGNNRDLCRVGLEAWDRFRVSTVFLGLDHAWGESELQLFETMIFDRENDPNIDYWCRRYASWEQAEHGHEWAVRLTRRYAGFKIKSR